MKSITKKIKILRPSFLCKKCILKSLQEIKGTLNGNIFDIGCGKKPYIHLFNYKTYIGLDLYSKQADLKISYDYFYNKIITGEYKNYVENFDIVLSTEVLEHTEEPEKIFLLANKLLKKGGKIIFTVPQTWELHEKPRDFYRFTKYGLEYLSKKTGFEVEIIKNRGGGVLSILVQINKLIYNRNRILKYLLYPIVIFNNIIGLYLDKLIYDEDNTLGYLLVAKKITNKK